MGLLDDLKAMLRRESEDAKEWIDEAVEDANVSLDRAERRTSTDPNERLQATLDDIADGEEEYSAVRDRAEGRAARPVADAELGQEGSVVFSESVDPGRDDPDEALPPVPGMAMARLWVRSAEESMPGFHGLWIDESVGPVVGEAWFAESFPREVEALAEVEEVVHEDREVLHVRGPGLSAGRARMLVASVLAPRIGEDWESRPPGD